MATIEDLPQPDISKMTSDDAIEYIRQIRLSRRMIKNTQSSAVIKKKIAKKAIPKVTKNDAIELLKLLEGI